MAVVLRSKAACTSGVARANRSRVVRVSCAHGETRAMEKVQLAAAAFAMTAILSAPAQAGVEFVKPERKKLFQSDAAAPAPVRKAPGVPGAKSVSAPAPKAEKRESAGGEGGFQLDPRSVALPGALAVIGGGFFAASKLDPDFDEFMAEAAVKDSTSFAGYEPTLKPVAGAPKTGTKKVKAATKKGAAPSAGLLGFLNKD